MRTELVNVVQPEYKDFERVTSPKAGMGLGSHFEFRLLFHAEFSTNVPGISRLDLRLLTARKSLGPPWF